jgi:hypothetical protein
MPPKIYTKTLPNGSKPISKKDCLNTWKKFCEVVEKYINEETGKEWATLSYDNLGIILQCDKETTFVSIRVANAMVNLHNEIQEFKNMKKDPLINFLNFFDEIQD